MPVQTRPLILFHTLHKSPNPLDLTLEISSYFEPGQHHTINLSNATSSNICLPWAWRKEKQTKVSGVVTGTCGWMWAHKHKHSHTHKHTANNSNNYFTGCNWVPEDSPAISTGQLLQVACFHSYTHTNVLKNNPRLQHTEKGSLSIGTVSLGLAWYSPEHMYSLWFQLQKLQGKFCNWKMLPKQKACLL